MRTYERTHSWITFALDLHRLSHRPWLLLGEAASKAHHVAGLPLLPAVRAQLSQLYLAKGVHATTAIEGNTLTEEQVLQRLQGELEVPPSKQYLAQEVDNVVRACNSIPPRLAEPQDPRVRVEDLCAWNSAILDQLTLPDGVIPGRIRSALQVTVGGYRGAPPEDCAYLVSRLCDWLNTGFGQLEDDHPDAAAILKAILGHLYVAWIHPFGDGNGRTARLLEVFLLYSSGVPATSAHLLSNHYNQTRSEYYRLLQASSRRESETGVRDFVDYALQGYVDGLREQIDLIKGQQLVVHLTNYIHEQFRGKLSAAAERQKMLALALVPMLRPVSVGEVRTLTTHLAARYARKTGRTVLRDLKALVELDLVRVTPEGVEVRRDLMVEYIPPQRRRDVVADGPTAGA